ncbi:hypothetical protein Bbelb_315150 [Branchiostoma belcheri]|nr:hypothetical protein Bbelb_315150 [Branchiostoma belcheri]
MTHTNTYVAVLWNVLRFQLMPANGAEQDNRTQQDRGPHRVAFCTDATRQQGYERITSGRNPSWRNRMFRDAASPDPLPADIGDNPVAPSDMAMVINPLRDSLHGGYPITESQTWARAWEDASISSYRIEYQEEEIT